MGLFDLGTFAQQPGWLSALLSDPNAMGAGAPGQMQGSRAGLDERAYGGMIGGAPQMPGMNAMAQAPQQQPPMQQVQSPPLGAPQMPSANAMAQAPQQAPQSQSAPNFLQSLGGGLQDFAASMNPQLQTRLDTQRSQAATLQSLIKSGVPPAIAQAAALNPEILKTIAPAYFDTAPKLQLIKNPLGGEDPYFYKSGGANPTLTPALGGAGGGGGSPGSSILAPGVPQFNDSLTGQERFNQYHPDIQATAKQYLNGDQIPTGNPRIQGIMPFAKTVATRYASDMGIPFSDNIYQAKRKMQTDLAASGNSTMGGILANGKSAFGHLALAAEDSVGLGNASSPIPHLDSLKNYTGNVLLPSSATKGKLAAARDSLGKFGTESTKFYAGTGGGVEERTAALKNNNPDTASGEQQASFFETEKRLMLERLDQKEAQIKDVLGEQYLKDHPVRDKLFDRNLARVDSAIAKLRGGGSDNAAPQANPYEAEMRKRGLLK